MNRQAWDSLLRRKEKELGFSEGYKFVYGPWDTLSGAEVAFPSLNPGKAPDKADKRTVSDERGNSYEMERCMTKSPTTDPFLRLAEVLGRHPADTLTGVAAPFRSDNWKGLSRSQRTASLELGRYFWRVPLNQRSLRAIVASSNQAAKLAVEVTEASRKPETIAAGWGNTKLRHHRFGDGKFVLHLPHLSRFKLLGRKRSKQLLREALRGAL